MIKNEGMTMKKIKILTISSSGFNINDGIGTVLYDYYKRFDLNRFEVHLAIAGKYNCEIIRKFKNIGVIPKFLSSRNEEVFKYFYDLIKLIRNETYDIVYTNGSSALLSVDLLAAKISGCKCRVVHSHNTKCDHERLDWILRPLMYALYTEAFACGNDAGKWLFKDRKFRVIRNGRSIQQYKYNVNERDRMRKKLAIPEGCVAVGHIGNFNEQKNQAFLVQLFSEVLIKKSNAMLFLIGEGSRHKDVQKITHELGIEKQVVFVGSTDDVPQFLQAMDIMVLPSLHEGLPLVVVEWQLAGLPCLVSDTVTKECVFTNFVEFESLENGSTVWASHLLNMQSKSLTRDDASIAKSARDAGYDIDIDAMELQKYFLKMVLEQ